MSQRVTNSQLDHTFAMVVQAATNLGVDTSRWSFGQHISNNYEIAEVAEGPDKPFRQISRSWATKRDAWDGMVDMATAFGLVETIRDVRG
jgi:hypothetical protein